MLITWKWFLWTILLMTAFSAVIGILMWKILQLNRTMKDRKRPVMPVEPEPSGNERQEEEKASPPPWAGAKNAKTTVFVFPTLVVQDSSDIEHRYRLNFEDFSIGRAGDNELVIARPDVAPHHARIVLDEQGYSLEDLGSESGTTVNGRRVNHNHRLQHMDSVVIGDATIIFEAM